MNKHLGKALVLGLVSASLNTQASEYRGYFDINTGLGTSAADWNIASDLEGTATPNIISELTWDNMVLGYIALDGERPLHSGIPWILRSRYQFSYALAGDNQDSDYDGDNRTLEFSRSNNEAGGYMSDWLLGFGYRFETDTEGFAVTPSVGYNSSLQHFTMTDGYQTINTRGTGTGPFSGLNSYFESEWSGPFVGIKVDSRSSDMLLALSLDYVMADYYAYGNWNLRSDLQHPKSFEHFSEGNGLRVGAKATFFPKANDWEVSLEYVGQRFELDPGTIQFNTTSGTATQRLNGGTTQTHYFGIAINRFF